MKKSLASLILITGSLSMAANSQLFLDSRIDHKSYSPNDAVGTTGYEVFQITRLKIDYQGKLGEQNSIRVRLDATQNLAAKGTRDNASSFMDLAYISHKFTDEVSFVMGKLVTGMGGIEGYVDSPADMYLRSVAGDEDAAVYYPVGAQADLTFGDHRVKATFANNTTDVNNGGTLNNTRGLMGASYLGKMMDQTLWVTASYHMEDYIITSGTKIKNSYSSLGAKYVMGDFDIEADYLGNKYDFDPQAAANKLSTISLVGLLRYRIADLGSVHVKYENSEQKLATSATADTKNKITGITAAFEYKPIKDDNWRMHVAFTQKDTKPEAGDTKTEKIVYAGMRLYTDFLK